MRRGSDPTLRNCMSESALTLAVVKDELSVLRVLLRHEKALEHTDVEGRTLLHLACRLGHLHAVDLLLTADCNPNVLDNNGCTPLMDAVLWRHQDIVQCLAPKCNVNFTGQRKITALIYAAQTNEPDCLRVLLNEGAGVNDQDVMGNTALILGGPYYPVIEALLSNKANPNVQNRYGMTALWYACYYHYRRVTALLLQANANPALPGNLRDRFRVSPFEIAFKRGHVSICRLLLAAGVPAEMVKPLLTSTFTKLFLEHPDSPSLLQEMQDHVSRPANLAQLTRLAIRSRLSSVCLLQRAQQLPLPAQLRAYVCMEDLQRRAHEAASASEWLEAGPSRDRLGVYVFYHNRGPMWVSNNRGTDWGYLTHWPLGDLNAILKMDFSNLLIGIFRSSHDNALGWMPHDLTDDNSELVQVMAWCHQAPSHYLSWCWTSSMSIDLTHCGPVMQYFGSAQHVV